MSVTAATDTPPRWRPRSTHGGEHRRRRRLKMPLGLVVPVALASLWWLSTDVWHLFSANQLPPIRQVWAAAVEILRDGDYLRHLGASLRRVAVGFAAGASAAVAIGVGVGLSSRLERLLDPTLQALRSVPSLAWVPFLLLWLGIDEAPKITLIAVGSFFPVYVNMVTAIRQVDRKLLEVGALFELSRVALVRRMFLPAAAPYVVVGLRIGLGQAWLFLVAAELIASTRGLGFMLIDGQNNLRPDIMIVGILSLAGLGKLSDGLFRHAERRWLGWTDSYGTARSEGASQERVAP
jgi:sulfonate transport system permease protein